jgi:putative transposase
MNTWTIDEMNVKADHIYLLKQLPLKATVSHAIELVKGGTSRVMLKEFPELRELLMGDSLWAGSCFAETVSIVIGSRIKQYIQTQQH